MATRYILALVIALAVMMGLQMSGVFHQVQVHYRIWTLRKVEHGDVAVLKMSKTCLNSNEISVRSAAAASFGRIGQADEATITDLIKKVDTDVPQVASSAAWSLGFICVSEPEGDRTAYQSDVVAALIRALSHQNGRVRTTAAHSLSIYGIRRIDASAAIPTLVSKLKDQKMGYMAARALGDIRARESAGDIAAVLEGLPRHFQQEGAVALSKLQPLSPEIQTQLDSLMQENKEVREAVEYSLQINQQVSR